MKILFVSQYFYPENFRINDLAEELCNRGHRVTVLTGIPNYPGGEYYEGYGLFERIHEKVDGVEIIRVPVIPRKKGRLMLSLNYLSFVIMGCLGARLMKKSDFDVIYAFGTSPITQAMPALTMKKRCGARVMVNVQDLWPDNVSAITGLKNKFALSLLDDLVDHIYNNCDVILGTSRSFVSAIKSRRGLTEKRKVCYWPQYAVVEKSEEKRRDLMPEGIFHIVFTGNVGQGQGLEMALVAADIIKSKGVKGICFDIVGDGRAREQLEREVLRMELTDYVKFHGSFPEEDIPAILNTADAALLILRNSPIFEKTIPAKLQTYLCCGAPVIGCVRGEARRLIEDNRVGRCTLHSSASSLAQLALDMMKLSKEELKEYSDNALLLSKREFDKKTLVDRLERYMRELSR